MRRAAIVAVVIAALAFALPASAENGKFTLGVLLGQQFMSGSPMDHDFGLGLQLGWNFTDKWALQGELIFSDPSVDPPLGVGELPPGVPGGADLMLGSINVVHFFAKEGRRWEPFVGFGASWGDAQYKGPYYQDVDPVSWGLNIAGGVRVSLAGTSFAVGELRWNSLFQPSYQAMQAMIGFGFGLGRVAQPAPPAEPIAVAAPAPEPEPVPEPEPEPEPVPPPVVEPEPDTEVADAAAGLGDVTAHDEGFKVTIPGVQFELDKAVIRQDFEDELTTFAGALVSHPDVDVRIEGHTCSAGADAWNQQLSERRAGAVFSFLQSQGVDPSRMLAVGYGETRPEYDNSTREGRIKNRRVEIVVLDDGLPQK